MNDANVTNDGAVASAGSAANTSSAPKSPRRVNPPLRSVSLTFLPIAYYYVVLLLFSSHAFSLI